MQSSSLSIVSALENTGASIATHDKDRKSVTPEHKSDEAQPVTETPSMEDTTLAPSDEDSLPRSKRELELKSGKTNKGLVRTVSRHDTSEMSEELKTFDKRYFKLLHKAAKGAAEDGDVKKFKYILGPSFTAIRGRDWNGVYPVLQWKFFDTVVHFLTCQELLGVLNKYIKLLQNEMLISEREAIDLARLEQTVNIPGSDKITLDKFKKTKQNFEEIKQSHDKIKKEMKSEKQREGLSKYEVWCIASVADINALIRGGLLNLTPDKLSVTGMSIDDKSIKLTETVQRMIRDIYQLWIATEVEKTIAEMFNIDQGPDLQEHLKGMAERCFEDLFKASPNLAVLKANIEVRMKVYDINREYDEFILFVNTNLQHYLLVKEKIEDEYRVFANDWIRLHEIEVIDELLSDHNGNGYRGARTCEELTNRIIKYKSFAGLSRHPSRKVAKLFKTINSLSNGTIRTELLALMEQHWNSPRFEHTVNGNDFKDINERRGKFAPTPEEKKAGKDMPAELQSETLRLVLRIVILVPFEWTQLQLLLDDLTCHTETQLFLKKQLSDYVQSKVYVCIHTKAYQSIVATISSVRSLSHVDKSADRRREVQYLIGCLYLARETGQDKGILYDKTSEGFSTGVTYVLESLSENVFASKLKLKLQGFIQSVTDGETLSVNPELRKMLAPPETPKLTMRTPADKENKEQPIQMTVIQLEKQVPFIYGKNRRAKTFSATFGLFTPVSPSQKHIMEYIQSMKDKLPKSPQFNLQKHYIRD